MDRDRRREINIFADRIRAALRLPGPPYDVEGAVRAIDGVVRELESSEALERGLEDACVRKVGGTFEIETSPAPETRRRFSIAHELGHLFLHMGYLVDSEKWAGVHEFDTLNRRGTTEQEYEAHEFAAAFLMPSEEFRDVAEKYRDGTTYATDRIAAEFNVSVVAAAMRGRWLGLFSWD